MPLSKDPIETPSPYASPNAALNANENFEHCNTQPFYSIHGRIGRVRYIAYGILINLVLLAGFMVAGIIAAILMELVGQESIIFSLFGLLLLALLIVGQIYSAFVPAKRRLNDLNQTGWLSLILLVPVVNLFFYLYLVFAPGNERVNDYGAPAEPPNTVMIVLAIIMPIIVGVAIIGILAAVAIPAYQDYVERAQGAQMSELAPYQQP